MDQGFVVSVGGEQFTVRLGDMTALDTMALRRETGFTFLTLTKALEEAPDLDLIAVLVWLARRTSGEKTLAFNDVAATIDYESEIDIVGEPGADADPEA